VHPRWILIRRPGLLRREPRRRVQRRRWGAPIVGGGNCRYTGCAADGGRYSQLFKAACAAAYSYAYDDVTSTITCAAGTAGYIVTFCPSYADVKS
ncbi:unnamed protein product, partial [Musa hybrid cultivar]